MIEFIYPPLCLHCQERVEHRKRLFCKGCAAFFELIDPKSRCPYCFGEEVASHGGPCSECIRKRRFTVKMASALDYMGPISTLVKQMKYGRMPYLAKTASAFMLAQYERLKWPHPDLIIPVPRRHWFQGMNHAELLAQQLAKRLNSQCQPLIKRRAGDLSQARLTQAQREALPSSGFYLKKESILDEKTILLVDDVITTGTTLRRCAEALSETFPAKVLAFSLARTLK